MIFFSIGKSESTKSPMKKICLPPSANKANKIIKFSILILFISLLILPGKNKTAEAASEGGQSDIDLITLPESSPRLLTVITPVLGNLQNGDNQPLLLLSTSSSPRPETAALFKHLDPGTPLIFTYNWKIDHPRFPLPRNSIFLGINPDISGFSIFIARKFWKETDQIVLASEDDQRSMILGSALAGNLGVPMIVYNKTRQSKAVQETLNELKVTRVLLANEKNTDLNHWKDKLKQEVEHFDAAALVKHFIAETGRENINAVVLTRIPEKTNQNQKSSAWLAPYYSLIRNAPVTMTDSGETDEATSQVMRLIDEQKLTPRSVVILGDYESIERRTVKIFETADGDLSENEEERTFVKDELEKEVAYRVEVEPCMPVNTEEIPSFGVGRIPFSEVEKASTFLTRGFVRDQELAGTEPRAMLAANAAAETRGLPLSETIARLSVKEFENAGLEIDAFYGDSVEGEKADESARRANLVIYHGHTGHEDFLPDALGSSVSQTDPSDPASNEFSEPEHESWNDSSPWGKKKSYSSKTDQISSQQLKGLPVVILQSCSSLRERFFQRIHPFGGVAKIGTDTAMHSASGTAIIKTFADSALYHNATLGEALRDAGIYFFLLQKLKDSRGHTKQPKSQRAALSFQLWGDPELKIFPQGTEDPRQEPAEIEFADSTTDTLKASFPAVEGAEVRTEEYFADFYPDAQVAGIVRRISDDEPRRIAPIHFFRKKVPAKIEPPSGRLKIANDDSTEAFFSLDKRHNYLYVIYYPEKRYYTDETYLLKLPKGGKQ